MFKLNFLNISSKNLYKQLKLNSAQLRLAEQITLIKILNDNKTIYTKSNSLVQVIKLEGKDYSGISFEQQRSLFEVRRQLFNQFSTNIVASFHYHRRKIAVDTKIHFAGANGNDAEDNSVETYINKVSQLWYSNFKDTYRTDVYLVVRIKLPIFLDKKKLFVVSEEKTTELLKIQEYRDRLDLETGKIIRLLEVYNPQYLVHTKDCKSELMKFWNYLINCSDSASLKATDNIGSLLSLSNIKFNKFGKRLVTITDNNNKIKYCKVLAPKLYPEKTTNQVIDSLLKVKRTFNVVQNILPVSREKNKSDISFLIKKATSNAEEGFVDGRITELTELANAVESGDLNAHWHIMLVYVYADSEKELTQAVNEIQGALGRSGIDTIQEGLALEVAYWSMLPDYEGINSGRKIKISTENIADFLTLGTSLEGVNKCAFGDKPVCLFKTLQHTNYSFTFHGSGSRDAKGHTIIIGNTGMGKTTLISFLLINCLKYNNLKILAFDSKNGLNIPVNVFGGEYINPIADKSTKLNPLLLPENNINKQFLNEWIAGLANNNVTLQDKEDIERIVRNAYDLDAKERNLGIVPAIVGASKIDNNDKGNLTAKLREWLPPSATAGVKNYLYGSLFNSNKDTLSFDKRIVAFDMTVVLDREKLLYPLSSYIFHTFEENIRANPCPHICFIDEMAQYLNNDVFSKFILKAVREWRKKNGVFIGAVQEPSVLTRSLAGQDMIKNLATLLLFPDVTASPVDYQEHLGLNSKEFEWIRTANPARQVMLKRVGGESVILDVNLSCLNQYLNLFSSNAEDVRKTEILRKKYETSVWKEKYLEVSRV